VISQEVNDILNQRLAPPGIYSCTKNSNSYLSLNLLRKQPLILSHKMTEVSKDDMKAWNITIITLSEISYTNQE